MNKIGPLLLFPMLLLVSCTNQSIISGKVDFNPSGIWRNKIYLIDPISFDGIGSSYMGKIIDSALVQPNGSFSFLNLPEMEQAQIIQLCVQKKDEKYLNNLDNEDVENSNYFPLIWQTGKRVDISTSVENFQRDFTIKNPSPENQAMIELRDLRYRAFKDFVKDELSDTHDPAELLTRERSEAELQKVLINFAENTEYLFPGLVSIRWTSPDANYERIPEFIFGQCNKWKDSNPDHPFVRQLCQLAVKDKLPLMIGDALPDFPMPMLSGDTVPLHRLLGERLTIIDLWASWCIPCRHENREILVPLWDQYHADGLQIVGYALDASESVWKKAIEKDGADRWLHASHLDGDNSPLFEALRIVTIPANFIVDDTGLVLKKNLHGRDLAKFLNEYFANY